MSVKLNIKGMKNDDINVFLKFSQKFTFTIATHFSHEAKTVYACAMNTTVSEPHAHIKQENGQQ